MKYKCPYCGDQDGLKGFPKDSEWYCVYCRLKVANPYIKTAVPVPEEGEEVKLASPPMATAADEGTKVVIAVDQEGTVEEETDLPFPSDMIREKMKKDAPAPDDKGMGEWIVKYDPDGDIWGIFKDGFPDNPSVSIGAFENKADALTAIAGKRMVERVREFKKEWDHKEKAVMRHKFVEDLLKILKEAEEVKG